MLQARNVVDGFIKSGKIALLVRVTYNRYVHHILYVETNVTRIHPPPSSTYQFVRTGSRYVRDLLRVI